MTHDAEFVEAELRFIERRASRKRPCRRCGVPSVRSALMRGPGWSVCSPCEPAIVREAAQIAIEPPLTRRCLVCGELLGHRRPHTKTCSDPCRNALSRILRRHRYGSAERRGDRP